MDDIVIVHRGVRFAVVTVSITRTDKGEFWGIVRDEGGEGHQARALREVDEGTRVIIAHYGNDVAVVAVG